MPIETVKAAIRSEDGHTHRSAFVQTGMSQKERIQASIDAMTSAFGRGDLEGILATYEPNAVVVGEPGKPAAGESALRELFRQFLTLQPRFEFFAHDIVEAGDIALHFNTWKMTGVAPDGSKVEQGGLSVAVLRQQADGRWLMIIDNPYGDWLLGK